MVTMIVSLMQPKGLAHMFVKMESKEDHQFPTNFSFGSASSSFQIEGAWNEDGKGLSIWDTFVQSHPERVADRSTPDNGSNSYHYYKEDVQALKQVGFHHYRFSISWPRIFPNGSKVNSKAIDYYSRLIDELIANKIEPIVTMYHWDMPQYIQDLGGLTNPLFVEYFKTFADVLYDKFGSRVKRWITFNEPFNLCVEGYGLGTWAPMIKSPGVGEYLCGHYLLEAHAAAYHLYKKKYFKKYHGEVGIVLDSRYFYPNDSRVDKHDIHRAQEYRLGWFANPIFSAEGGYPQVMIDEIAKKSIQEGRPWSRLPVMSKDLKKSLLGSSDFLGFNYYTSRMFALKNYSEPLEPPSWDKDNGYITFPNIKWPRGKSDWLYSVPEGLRDLLNWMKTNYNNPPVFITENGWSDAGTLEDNGRIEYYKHHLKAVSKAIYEDKCNVIGYTVWSLLDSFEWIQGFTEKFGIFSVNLTMKIVNSQTKNDGLIFGKYLLLTNTVSAAVLMCVGESVAQKIENSQNLNEKQTFDYDKMKQMFIVGAGLGPIHHYIYLWMEHFMPGNALKTIVKKLFTDQLIVSPICISQFFYSASLLEGKSLAESTNVLKSKFLTVYITDWSVWPAAQFLNFYFIPLPYRVLYINVMTMFYNCYLCYVKNQKKVVETIKVNILGYSVVVSKKMLKLSLVILSIVVWTQGCLVINPEANGVSIERNAHPGHVLIENFQSYKKKLLCSGVLISARYVLTTASCVADNIFVNVHLNAYTLRDVYEEKRVIYRAKSVKIRPGYDKDLFINDVAIILLPDTLIFLEKSYAPVDLPGSLDILKYNALGKFVGWGILNYEDTKAAVTKQEIEINAMSEAKCRETFGLWKEPSESSGRACVAMSDSKTNCVSDVGSPFMIGNKVYGLLSFGQKFACSVGNPNGIQEIRFHVSWIRGVTGML
ncbi:unnamed protein product [Diamesa hyperborea]